MLTLTFSEAKNFFFDATDLLSAADRARAESLERGAKTVRLIARRSMRKSDKPSKPGRPPSARTDRKRGMQLRDKTLAIYDPSTRTAVVGPAQLSGGRAVVPSLLERGGTIPPARRVKRRIGGGGPIELLSGSSTRRGAKAIARDPLGRKAVYIKLLTNRQVARATYLEDVIYDVRYARVAARPYMAPALEKSRKYIVEAFRGSVRA